MQKAPKPSFIRRYGVLITIGAAVLIAGGWALAKLSDTKPKPPKPREFTMVQVSLPPPPPPPPPPREEPQPRDDTPAPTNEMTVPDPVATDQPDAPADDADSDAGESMGTNVQSDGPADGFGLVGRGSGGTIGGRGGSLGGGRGGNRSWDSYSAQAGTAIRGALSQHDKTRAASLRLPVSIWPNAEGVIERVRLDASTGSTELDQLLETEVLIGLRLSGPPPADMPLPIRIRINAQRPN